MLVQIWSVTSILLIQSPNILIEHLLCARLLCFSVDNSQLEAHRIENNFPKVPSWKRLKLGLELSSPNSLVKDIPCLCFYISFSSLLKCQPGKPFLNSPKLIPHHSLIFFTLPYLYFSVHLAVPDVICFLGFFPLFLSQTRMQTQWGQVLVLFVHRILKQCSGQHLDTWMTPTLPKHTHTHTTELVPVVAAHFFAKCGLRIPAWLTGLHGWDSLAPIHLSSFSFRDSQPWALTRAT